MRLRARERAGLGFSNPGSALTSHHSLLPVHLRRFPCESLAARVEMFWRRWRLLSRRIDPPLSVFTASQNGDGLFGGSGGTIDQDFEHGCRRSRCRWRLDLLNLGNWPIVGEHEID